MKTIIAGSRSITKYETIKSLIQRSGFEISEVVCGTAKGVDMLGSQWATENKIPVRFFPAKWSTYGKSAGYKRNEEMAEYAGALIAIWDGESPGTKHMIDLAKKKGMKVKVFVKNKPEQKGETYIVNMPTYGAKPYYAIDVIDGKVTKTAPIGGWMIGKKLEEVTKWIQGKNGEIKEL